MNTRLLKRFKQTFIIIGLLQLFSYEGWTQLDTIHYFPPIHSRQNSQIAEQYAYLSTPEVTPFLVTLVDGGGDFIGSAIISKDSPANIFIGSGQAPGTPAAVPKDSLAQRLKSSGIIASGDYDFYCNIRVKSSFQATSVACKGRAALGKTFYAGSMPQVVSNTNRNFITSIMATENGTVVVVNNYNPAVLFETSGPAVGPDMLTILLNAGDCYVMSGYTTSTLANMDGFIGAKITSNKDIAVNTGNYMGSIHTEGLQDAGMVQIVPTNWLGTNHVVVEGGGGPIMERPLVVGIADGTEIFLNDAVTPVTTIDEGEYYLVPNSYYSGTLHKNMVIRTSIPAYVYQATAATTSSATSEFNFIPPLACYLTDFIDAIPDIDRIGPTIFDGVLYIITTAGSTVSVNGTVLGGAAGPEPSIGLPDWETYKLSAVGDVAVTSTGAMAAGFISVNGYAGAGAYYAGFNFDFQVETNEDLEVCLGEEVLLYATGAGDGGTYVWEDGVFDSVAFTPTESMVYYVTGTNIEGCEDEDSIIVTVYDLPTSFAGLDQSICDTSATTLAGSAPLETGEGTWTMISGPSEPTFIDDSDSITIVGDLIEGVYALEWAVSNGTCDAVTDTVLIYVYDTPVSDAGPDQDICDDTLAVLAGNIPLGSSTGEWSLDFGPTIPVFSDSTAPDCEVSGLEEGTYSFFWTVSNGSCLAAVDTVQITIYDLPVSNAGEDVTLCGIYEAELNANTPVGTATGIWTVLSSPAMPTFSDMESPTSLITDLEEGTYVLLWNLSNGSCDLVQDTVVVTIFDFPASNAGPDQTLCESSSTALNASTPAGSSDGVWTFADGPSIPSFADSFNPNSEVSGLVLGTYHFVWTVTNGVCDNATDTVEITINPNPTINIVGAPLMGCAPLTVGFSNYSTPAGDACEWKFGDGAISDGCGDVVHTYNSGEFDVTLTVTANGCTTSETFADFVYAAPIPTADFNPFPNVISVTNTTVKFRNYSSNATDYTWNFGDELGGSSEFEPTFVYPETEDGVYEVMLIAENEFDCADTTYRTIVFEDVLLFYVPNAIIIDGSGNNQIFKPVVSSRIDPYNFNMKIFNRWGELIFETYNYNTGWNGSYLDQLVEDGVYIWTINFSDTNSDKRYSFDGHVTVLR
jgi:gliding motility-associated-like protein